jgi:curved DNA-binding protein CbpA
MGVGEKIHSHYDNLKVSRDAPPEVIRAAYKALSQKYHPDRRPDDLDAARIIKIINGSYAVLRDPAQRKDHDEWLARKEREAVADATPKRPSRSSPPESDASPQPTGRPQPEPQPRGATPKQPGSGRFARAVAPMLWIAIIALGIGGVRMWILGDPPKPYAQQASYVPEQDQTAPTPEAKASDSSTSLSEPASH